MLTFLDAHWPSIAAVLVAWFVLRAGLVLLTPPPRTCRPPRWPRVEPRVYTHPLFRATPIEGDNAHE